MVEAEGGPTNGKIEDDGAPKKGDGGEGELLLGVGLTDNQFLAGDFVWGKIKHHPWWPGQVYDSSDASEYAKKLRRRDEQCVLVAYFGDRTFAWCKPSQLRLFSEGFEEMAHQSISKNFLGALKEALDEIQGSLESEILGNSLSARHVVNAGIRERVTGPEGRVKWLSIVDKMPAEMLERLHEVACDVSCADLLEITAIKSWFSALARLMGWRMEHPVELEDEKVVHRERANVNGGPPLGVSAMESSEEVEPGRPAGEAATLPKGGVGGKLSHRKKVRSMAELIAETDMDVIKLEDGIDREEKPAIVKKLDSLGRQQRKKSQAKSSDSENVDVEREEGSGSGRRERKRSRYLSPPYTTMRGRAHHSSVFLKDGEVDHPKEDIEASETGDSETRMENSHPIFSKCSTEVAPDDKMVSTFEGGGGASAEDMLFELWCAALDSTCVKGDLSSSRFRMFFDRFRDTPTPVFPDYGESGIEEFRSEPDDGRCNFYLDGESEPNVDFEAPYRSPASSGCKSTPERRKKPLSCDTDDSGVSKSEEKSISVAQGTSGSEKVIMQPKRNEEDETNGDDEAAIQLTLGSGPTVSPYWSEASLQFIKKSLEGMISALRSSFPLPGKATRDPSDGLEPAARENLVCEMNGLLKKVDELMAGSTASGPA